MTDVSILIAAFNPQSFRRCLSSLETHLPGAPQTEVIAVLNGPSEALRAAAKGFDGVRLIDAPTNLGFAAGCNLARSAASGRYLGLVQDDVEIEAGWLEALVAAAEAHPEAGAVGGMAIWPSDGTVQNAGPVLWANGSHTELGSRREAVGGGCRWAARG